MIRILNPDNALRTDLMIMSDHPLSDLLPIPPGVTKPNAYDVFGLNFGEQDNEIIQSTIRSVIANLKAQKSNSDSKRWKAAARLATDAKDVLADPGRKEQMDQQRTKIAASSVPESFAAQANSVITNHDPLAGLLPDSDPLLAYEMDSALNSEFTENETNEETSTVETESSLNVESLQGLLSESLLPSNDSFSPQDLLDSIENVSSDADSIEIPGFDETSPEPTGNVKLKKPVTNRRRRSKTGMMIPAVFAVSCFGIVGLVLYFIINKPGVVVTVSNDGFSVNAANDEANADEAPAVVEKPRNADPPKPADPVMGSLGPDSKQGKEIGNNAKLSDPIPKDADDQKPEKPEQMSDTDSGDGAVTPPDGKPIDSMDKQNPQGDPPPDLTKPQDPSMEALSPEVLEEANQVLQNAAKAIADANWDQMNSIANSMLDQEMSAEQKERAEELFQVIDLAIFYRTAIIDSISNLNVGNDFEVTDDFRVIVVETTPNSIVVRYNTQNKSYTIDDLPWPLAHKLASFEVSGAAFSTAAKSVYQFIAPKTNAGLREQALQWIDEIQTDLDGTEKEMIGSTHRSLIEDN